MIEKAKSWLKEHVEKETDWQNFTIKSTKMLSDNEKQQVIKCDCSYTWKLNAWEKEVNREIYTVRNNGRFHCSL